MWIVLGILGFILLLILIILMLPVFIIIKTDDNGELILRYKILFWTFGEDPDPDNPVVQIIKKSSGISKIESKNIKKSAEKEGFLAATKEIYSILISLISEIIKILKYCTATKFELKIVCVGDDAADAAINYGECCAITYPILGLIASKLKIKKKGKNIAVTCSYTDKEDLFFLNLVIKVRLFRLLAAFIRIAYKEAMRQIEADSSEN